MAVSGRHRQNVDNRHLWWTSVPNTNNGILGRHRSILYLTDTHGHFALTKTDHHHRHSWPQSRPPAPQLTPNNAISHRPLLLNDPQASQQLTKSLFGFTNARKCDRCGFCRRARRLCDADEFLGADQYTNADNYWEAD